MSKLTILKGGVELANESGGVNFVTDWHKIDIPSGLGKNLTLSIHFPNTLNQVENMVMQVSNQDGTPTSFVELLTVGTDEGIAEEVEWKQFRMSYEIFGAVPTGNITSINAELL